MKTKYKVTAIALILVLLASCAVVIIDSNKNNDCRKISTGILDNGKVCVKEKITTDK